MKNRKRLVASIFSLGVLFLPVSSAIALDVPLLTWEKGKTQSVVLGGGSTDASWKVLLKSSSSAALELNSSRANENGFVVYSISIPRDLVSGAYSIVTIGENSPETLVAAIEIIDMRTYSITQVPTDLKFILLALVFWFASLTALRGLDYRTITLVTSTGPKERYLAGEPSESYIEHAHKFVPFEKIRIRIYDQIPDSLFKHLMKSDSRGLHLNLPYMWALLPLLCLVLIVVSVIFGGEVNRLQFEGTSRLVFIFLVFLGSLDIFAGLLTSVAYFAVTLWLIPEFSVAGVSTVATHSLLFLLPALSSAYFTVLTNQKRTSNLVKSFNSLLFRWIAPAVVVHSLFLISRSLTSSVEPSFSLEVMVIAATWSGQQVQLLLSRNGFLKMTKGKVVEEFDLNIGRLISPFFTLLVFVYFQILFYIWTESLYSSVLLSLMVIFPLFFLLIRPTWSKIAFVQKIARNHLLEVALVVVSTLVAFWILEGTPIIDTSSSALFISAGLLPIIFFTIFAFITDTTEKLAPELEVEA